MVLGVTLFPIVNGGKNLGRVVTIGAVGLALCFAGITALPGADQLVNRFRSLGAMQDDSSFQGRIMIAQGGWGKVLENPAGYGVGSSGLSGRINTGSQFNDQSVISDNGWLTLMTALGLPGFLLFAMALVTMWRYFSSLTRVGVTDDYLGLAKAFFVATVIMMWEGNFFTELSVMWIAMGRALSPLMLYKIKPEFRPIAGPEYSRALRI
jgi:O-antigen ligase